MLSELIVNKRKIRNKSTQSSPNIDYQIQKIVRDFITEYTTKFPLSNTMCSDLLPKIKQKLSELLHDET